MNSREWDPTQTIGSDIHVLTEMIRHLREADPKLVCGSLGELRIAFLDLWKLIDGAEQTRGIGGKWRDQLVGDTSSKTGP